MTGDDRVRFCTQCNLHVHNLSAMTADEAAAFLAMRDGRVCVAYERRSDGSAVFANAWEGRAASRGTPLPVLPYQTPPAARRRWVVPAAVAGAVVTAGAATAVLNGKGPPPVAAWPAGTAMVAGGIGPPAAVQFDPRNASGKPIGSTICVANVIKHDATANRLAATLPGGIELIDVKYSVYPPGARAGWGRCYVLGTAPSEESPASIAAVLWLLPNARDLIDASDEDAGAAWARTAERVRDARGGEWLIDTEDGELSRFLANVLAEPPDDGNEI